MQKEQIGWQSELNVALSVKNRIFIHGNIYDVYLHEGKPFNLIGWLVQELQNNYELILGYDIIDGQQVLLGEEQWVREIELSGLSSPKSSAHEVSTAETSHKPPANPRTAPRRKAPQIGGRVTSPETTDPSQQLQRLRLILENQRYKTALVCMHSDKLVAHERLLGLPEKKYSVLLSKLTEQTWKTNSLEKELDGNHNLVVLIYDQEGLIPVDLYLNDPSSQVIHISYPSFRIRSQFFFDYWERFYGYQELKKITHSPADMEETSTSETNARSQVALATETGNQVHKIKNYESFARLTEGFTYRELFQLCKYSQAAEISIKDFQQLMFSFRFGEKENPWDSINEQDLLEANGKLNNEVIGQEEAIVAVNDMLQRAKAELGRHGSRGAMKPRGILFFVGPTGVGKTLLARKLAEILFGTEEACTIFDMSEFKEEHTLSRLIGSPPGYVGHETGGQLTNKVRERPFSVFLFDEIEKANKKILDIFLQILESGRLTDGKGQTVSFSEAVIMFTSNIGTIPDEMIMQAIQKETTGTRLSKEDLGLINMPPHELKERLPDASLVFRDFYFRTAVKSYFHNTLNRPELYNRLGGNVYVFNYLTMENCKDISGVIIRSYFERIREKWKEKRGVNASLNFQDENQIVKLIQDLVLDPHEIRQHGARGLESLITFKLETPLAILFNRTDIPSDFECKIVVKDGKISFERIFRTNNRN